MNRKGISGVVVAILIILIAVIAVSIFWVALRPAIEKTTTQIGKGEECLYLNLKVDSVSYNDVSDELTVYVFRDAGEADLKRVRVIYGDKSYDSADAPLELETKKYTITGVTTKPANVKIGGILSGNITCALSDTAEVP